MSKAIVFITYESPWFPAGGIAAVMGQLPSAVQSAGQWPTVVLTPFHRNSAKIGALQMSRIGSEPIDYDGVSVSVEVQHHAGNCPWFFLKAVDSSDLTLALRSQLETGARPFFDGERHPYDVPKKVLLRDSLFFGAAAAQVLPMVAKHLELDKEVEWNLIAQDWEAATALLAFKGRQGSHGSLHLTLHNSYDEFATAVDLRRVGIDPKTCPGDTILHRAFSVIKPPAFTVSEQFALDFTQDLLQREVMAPQLQAVLNSASLVGVDNGPFKPIAVDPTHLQRAASGDFAPLQAWKAGNRRNALTALDAHIPTGKEPVWGEKSRFRRDDSPWFVMAGRDDPRQKGYDVAAAAIEEYLKEHHGQAHCAQFLFFPIPGDEGLAGLEFLNDLASRFAEDVAAFPFLWIAGFTTALQGAAYGLMPSLYEPFGMANEFYLAGGCVGIGRATGGNLEQIVPLRATSACSRAVRIRADSYHGLSATPTGILFREKDEIVSAADDWRAINDAQYNRTGGSPSRVEERRGYAVFQEMVRELRIAIEDGIHVYTKEPQLYYRMLAEGIAHIQRTFSWQRAGQEYARKVG